VLGIALLLCGCSDIEKKEARDQAELTRSLVAAADSAVKQGDPATAATYYRGALARDPNNMPAAIGLMDTLRVTGGLDEARAVAEKALATKPNDPGVVAEAGKVKLATGQLDDAIKLLKRAVAADAQDWKSRSALGLAYDRVGEYAEAEKNYRAALVIEPDNPSVLNNFALSRAMVNDLAGARELLQQAAASPNADVRVRQNLALVYALSGDMAKAEALARHDLPPALVGETLDYYRELSASAASRTPSDALPHPALKSPDRSDADSLAPKLGFAFPMKTPPAAASHALPPVELAEVLPPTAAPPPVVADNPPPAKAPQVAVLPAQPVLAASPPPAQAVPMAQPPTALAAAPNPAHLRWHVSHRFTVQIGTYQSLAPARRAGISFAAKGLAMKVEHVVDRHGHKWFVLRGGEFETGAEAHDLLRRAQELGCFDAFVVRHEIWDEMKA
jgi:Flp pilus assembly protein TadD